MKRHIFVLLVVVIISGACMTIKPSKEDMDRQHSAAAIILSDFSYKITGYYQEQGLEIPKNFDVSQFFNVLEKKYPDQTNVKYVRRVYKVFVRPFEGGYSVMLCDPETNEKVMEDFSCHLSRLEIRSWQSDSQAKCEFETNWKKYCE